MPRMVGPHLVVKEEGEKFVPSPLQRRQTVVHCSSKVDCLDAGADGERLRVIGNDIFMVSVDVMHRVKGGVWVGRWVGWGKLPVQVSIQEEEVQTA